MRFPLPYGNSERTTSVCKWRFLYWSDLRVIASILAAGEAGTSSGERALASKTKKRGVLELRARRRNQPQGRMKPRQREQNQRYRPPPYPPRMRGRVGWGSKERLRAA